MTHRTVVGWFPSLHRARAGDLPGTRDIVRDGGAGGEDGPRRRETWAVVLAGGAGMRLQRFVGQVLGTERPKQFCRIIGSRSMLRHTWDRALQVVDPDRIVTIITAGQEAYLDEEAREGVPGIVLVQPANKGTAPGLLLPLLWIARRAPGALVATLPADHFVWEEDRFAGHLRAALGAAQHWPARLALLGVEADRPNVGYGWIAPGQPLAGDPHTELYAVRRFWEKPDRQTAAHLFACGHFWNTLILAGRLETYLGLAAAWVPQVLGPLRAVGPALGAAPAAAALAEAYGRIRPADLSEAVLAQCPGGLMVLAARGVCWSDWGDPDHIIRTLRRFDWQPSWLPSYQRGQAPEAAGS